MTTNESISGIRIGQGVDMHRLVPGGPLHLGGVVIPYDLHLDGHSDADVVAHAIADALLSAAGHGDLGTLLPADDPSTAGISGAQVLSRVAEVLAFRGARLLNVDCSVVCDSPPLARYVPDMVDAMAEALGVSRSNLSIKPRHAEGLGFVGRDEGVFALAVALIAFDCRA